ncbi:Phytosulfokine receptor 1 [Ananas comosus]|uniref:Phytosulfokine receptor 1 n=1 Tax=Ananas comosus TaxID=4615 RepID=A0A199UWM0_ANACO|nr:Phytosulfokine receptor 1 [Ananas comosus]
MKLRQLGRILEWDSDMPLGYGEAYFLMINTLFDKIYVITAINMRRLSRTRGGISCDLGSVSVKRVIGLDLSNKSLKGSVSSSLGGLDRLKQLNLSNNSLNGSVPVELFHLPHLELLDLSMNMLSGLIPVVSNLPSIRLFNISANSFRGTHPIFAGSSNLSVYDVSSNSFSGPVNTGICNSSDSIQVLRFSANMLSGEFPVGFGNCGSLSKLSLDANGLTGTLPDDLFTLSSLTKLNLQGNSLSGTVSNKMRNLSNVVRIDTSSNNFSGVIPNVFDSLHKLEFFDASSNELTGGLPPSLSNCSTLITIRLNNNFLTGNIDLNFTALPRLKHLSLGMNFFSGRIPSDLPSCLRMQSLNLGGNNLVGEIPSSFRNFTSLAMLGLYVNNFSNLFSALQILQSLPNLTYVLLDENFRDGELMPSEGIQGFANTEFLSISDCSLSGSIPPWLANLTKLKSLNISSDYLSGRIPSWLGNLDALFYLDFSSNLLTGEIPTSLTRMRSLMYGNSSQDIVLMFERNSSGKFLQYSSLRPSIILNNNKLVGSILPGFNSLVNLHVLDLSFNDISGTIPDLSGMSNLESLDLSHNHLTGAIPPSLSRLHFLSNFSVAYNNLSGQIPKEGQFDTFNDPSIYMDNYYLCGPPTENNCSKNSYTDGEGNNETKTTWSYFEIGLGFVIGFWSICGILIFKESWSNTFFEMIDKLFYKIYIIIIVRMRRGLPCFCSLLLLLPFAPLTCSQSQQSCNSGDLNALQGFVERLESSALGWSFSGSSSSNCCNWAGISCDAGFPLVKRVIGLDLSNKSLKGSVSSSLGGLDQLKQLNLSYNSLRGLVPVELFHLPHLELLDLSTNVLSGLIPAELNLSSIQVFNISFNSFNGRHPILAGSSNLSVYDVSSNSFSGPVNTGICNSSDSIQVLRFSANMFSGDFPAGFGNCSSLSELSLDANGLTGTLPDDLFTLSSLTKLNLQENSLSGTVSTNNFGNLSKLVHIDIFSNNFSGTIPNVFDRLSELNIWLSNNSLTGNIDLNFTALPRLKHLSLGWNFFSGRIPSDLPNCLQMQILNLGGNNLVGEIPSSFKNFTSLAILWLSDNNFFNLFSALQILQSLPSLIHLALDASFRGGELMPSDGIQGFANTELLFITFCGLSGSIPPWLTNLTKLKFLNISWNRLTGTIPSWLGNLNNLSYLDISNNLLIGEIPSSLTRMKSLVYGNSSQYIGFLIIGKSNGHFPEYSSLPPSIILSNNKLVGSILPGFNGLVNLYVLDLSFNDISGAIPDLSGMSNLESLDLSHNYLTGAIPPSLTRLHFLSSFNVAYNNLSVQIPTEGQFDTLNNPSIYMDNYYLCGPPTKNNCSKEEPNPYPKRDDNNETHETIWLYLGMGSGFVIGFWGVYVMLLFRRSWRIAYFQMTDKLFDDIYVMVVLSWRWLNEKIGRQRPIS